jgi:hypothetical protein
MYVENGDLEAGNRRKTGDRSNKVQCRTPSSYRKHMGTLVKVLFGT